MLRGWREGTAATGGDQDVAGHGGPACLPPLIQEGGEPDVPAASVRNNIGAFAFERLCRIRDDLLGYGVYGRLFAGQTLWGRDTGVR